MFETFGPYSSGKEHNLLHSPLLPRCFPLVKPEACNGHGTEESAHGMQNEEDFLSFFLYQGRDDSPNRSHVVLHAWVGGRCMAGAGERDGLGGVVVSTKGAEDRFVDRGSFPEAGNESDARKRHVG